MAKGRLHSSGIKVTYAQVVADQIQALDEYELLARRGAIEDVRRMSDLERQAEYIKLHWDLGRFSAGQRDKADRGWRRQNKALTIKAQSEGLLDDPEQAITLDRLFTDNLILQEQMANVSFWTGRVGFHANMIAMEKNARDLLGIQYPGDELAERRNDPTAA
jgi:hypothetical protein